jgi:hypothetical protein
VLGITRTFLALEISPPSGGGVPLVDPDIPAMIVNKLMNI